MSNRMDSNKFSAHRFIISCSALTTFIVSIFVISPVFATSQLQETLDKKQFHFIKNTGQKNSAVAYYAQTLDGTVFVTQQGELVYSLPKNTEQGMVAWAFKETFLSTDDLKPNQTGDKQFVKELALGQLAPGVQLKLKSQGNNVEKLFHLSAGADVTNIKAALEGIEGSHLNKQGQLVLKTGIGPVAFTKPVAFQMRGDKKEFVKVSYTLNNDQYGFTLGEYDHSRELVIDPLLASTYVGGGGGYPTYAYDTITAIIPAGDYVYASGGTHSPDFPTALGYDSSFNEIREGFVLRFTSDLSTLVNATFIGNTVYDIAVDTDGTVVAAGQTGTGFPKTAGAYSYPSDYDQSGAFIARFSADLSTLMTAGVVVNAPGMSVVTIGNGAIYFSGSTNNPNLQITPNAIGQDCNCDPSGAYGLRPTVGFMGRVSSDLSSLEVLSYLSSSPSNIVVSADSSVYTAGSLIRQYDADISASLATTSGGVGARSIAIGDGYIVGVGSTGNSDLPATSGAFDTTCGTDGVCNDRGTEYYMPFSDGYVVKYSMDLQTILALTYIGGSGSDYLSQVAINSKGDFIVAGGSYSSDFPTTSNAFNQSYNEKTDIIVARMSSDLSTLAYSSYIGGTHDDRVMDLALDSSGNVFIGGQTDWHDNFPTTPGAFDTTYNGEASDGFISKFDTLAGGSTPTPDPDPTPDPMPDPDPTPSDNVAPVADAGSDQEVGSRDRVYLDGSASSDSDGSIVSYQWTQVSGKSRKLSNADEAVANFRAPRLRRGRTYTLVFELAVTDDQGTTSTDQVTVEVR